MPSNFYTVLTETISLSSKENMLLQSLKSTNTKLIAVNDINRIWSSVRSLQTSKNDYSIFDGLKDCHGIYMFIDPKTRKALYIGSAIDQDLKTRVSQHFKEKDTGGTFKNNYIDHDRKSFNEFKSFIGNKQILFFILENKNLISDQEKKLIASLNSKYNINHTS